MSSRAGKKHKSKAIDQSTDWCEWVLDEPNSRYCRVRTDADGRYEYQTAPADSLSQQTPRSQSGSNTLPFTRNTTTAESHFGNLTYGYPLSQPSESSVQTLSNTITSLNIGSTDTPVESESTFYDSNTSQAAYSPHVSESIGESSGAVPIPVPSGQSRSFPYNVRYSASAPVSGYMPGIAGKATTTTSGYFPEGSFGYYPQGQQRDASSYAAYQPTQTSYDSSSAMTAEPNVYPEPGPSRLQPVGATEATGSGTANPKAFHKMIRGTEGTKERLDPKFRIHSSKLFKPGQASVFKVLWSEPRGETHSNATDVTSFTLGETKYGEKVHSSIRRFVIVAADKGHCQCLPILTYQYQATPKSGVKRDDHAIVYIGKTPPKEFQGERLSKGPIEVIPKTARDKLEPESRINYAKIYTVEHNVKVCFIGHIASSSESRFMTDFDATWNNKLQMSQGYN